MFSQTFVLLALSASAFATVYTTSPTASTVFTGGKEATVSWQDDGKAPSLKDFGPAKVSIYAGNAQQQTLLQSIVENVDVSTTQTIKFTPNANIGPPSGEYFIRFESLSLKDAAAPQFPALAFSAKFNMDGMTGTFSPEVQEQIKGQATAPLAGATVAPTAGNTPSTTPAGSSTKTSSRAPTSTRSASSTAASNAAVSTKAGWFGIILGAVVGASMF